MNQDSFYAFSCAILALSFLGSMIEIFSNPKFGLFFMINYTQQLSLLFRNICHFLSMWKVLNYFSQVSMLPQITSCVGNYGYNCKTYNNPTTKKREAFYLSKTLVTSLTLGVTPAL